jgi:hypothetical protein
LKLGQREIQDTLLIDGVEGILQTNGQEVYRIIYHLPDQNQDHFTGRVDKNFLIPDDYSLVFVIHLRRTIGDRYTPDTVITLPAIDSIKFRVQSDIEIISPSDNTIWNCNNGYTDFLVHVDIPGQNQNINEGLVSYALVEVSLIQADLGYSRKCLQGASRLS